VAHTLHLAAYLAASSSQGVSNFINTVLQLSVGFYKIWRTVHLQRDAEQAPSS
jgi:hypothetical protein